MSSSKESTEVTEQIISYVRSAVTPVLTAGSSGDSPAVGSLGTVEPTLLAGVSGGVDSAVLLWALSTLSKELGAHVVACHLDHGLRSPEEAEADRRAVTALAESLGIALHTDAVPPGLIERELSRFGGLEATARHFRYTFFSRVAEERGAVAICLGHHRDDQLETVLMRLATGGDPVSFAGIPRERPLSQGSACRILRPLLGVGKSDIRLAAQHVGLPAIEDATNKDNDRLRNAIRNRLIPFMSELVPDLPSRLAGTQRRAGLLREFIETEIEVFPWRREAGSRGETLSASMATLIELDPYLRLHVLVDAVRTVSDRTAGRVSDAFLRPLLDRGLSEDVSLTLTGYNVVLSARAGHLRIEPAPEPVRAEGFLYIARETEIQSITVSGRLAHRLVSSTFVADTIADPVILRNRRPGDQLVRAGGTRTVKRILIDLGVERERRDLVPILEDRHGILAVVASAVGCEDALREGVRHGHASSEHVIFQLDRD